MSTEIDIPPIPQVAHKVLLFDPNNESASSQTLEKIIAPDKGICSKILKVSNSAYYGRSGRVDSIRDAITLLGLKNAKNLILMMSTMDMSISLKGEVFQRFIHAFPVLSGLIGFDLCEPAGQGRLREEAFLAGLLFKIGMSLIALNKKGHYELLLQSTEKVGSDILELERMSYGIDHIEIGIKLFASWNMPTRLQNVMSEQNFLTGEIEHVGELTRLVVFAGMIARKHLDIFSSKEETERMEVLLKYFNMDENNEFFSSEYHGVLREHPFYQIAVYA